MDGSKFQSVYLEIEECFKEALEKATRRTPENDLLIQTTMRILRDVIIWAVRQNRILVSGCCIVPLIIPPAKSEKSVCG